MLPNRATPSATAAYALRFPDLPGNYRSMLGMSVGSIGIGTYLGEPTTRDDAAYEAALEAAILGGINLIDTAVNYRFQRSERAIGRVIRKLVDAGSIRREEVVVATKGGYLAFDGEMPAEPREWLRRTLVDSGVVGAGDVVAGSHCMAPRYLDLMIETSRTNLGLETLDIYYLHNPETQLAELNRAEFKSRIRTAFETLEARVADGKVGVYGIATWDGLRVPTVRQNWLSLDELLEAAQEAGGKDHHFRAIQLPYNLAMPEALTLANQNLPDGPATTLATAQAAGMAVCASATLLQGRLAQGLPELVGEAFAGLSSDAQRALQFVRSTPGVSVALVGMKAAAHVRENLATARHPPAPFEQLMKLFKRG